MYDHRRFLFISGWDALLSYKQTCTLFESCCQFKCGEATLSVWGLWRKEKDFDDYGTEFASMSMHRNKLSKISRVNYLNKGTEGGIFGAQ